MDQGVVHWDAGAALFYGDASYPGDFVLSAVEGLNFAPNLDPVLSDRPSNDRIDRIVPIARYGQGWRAF